MVFSCFFGGFQGSPRWFYDFSWFLAGFHAFIVFHGVWLVSMLFQGGFMVYHDFWVVSMFFSRWFHGLSWFIMVFGWFTWFC